MARIRLDHIRHAYSADLARAGNYALREVDHEFEDGGAYALLGPSGCGKTTLLNIISGLLTPSEGHVRFGDRDVTLLSPEARNIAQVFQFPVVYDTMTVRENLAFPLKNRKVPKDEIDRRVADMLQRIGLAEHADRRAQGLTADEKQKISLGRGLVRSDVNAILFDEPLTVIDPHMKWQLRSQLKELHRQFRMTMVYVTHDQTEALTFADKVVVMYDGEVVQIGTPEELFERPKHTFVGYFIGSPGMNVLTCAVEGTDALVSGTRIALPGGARPANGAKKTELGIRPEFVRLVPRGQGMPVTVTRVEDIGSERIVRADFNGQKLVAIIGEGESVPTDTDVVFDPSALNLYADSWLVERSGTAPGDRAGSSIGHRASSSIGGRAA
jgi:glycerol transport system ATP-binding protein